MVLEQILNPVFSPLLNIPPFWAVFLVSLILSILITFIYKWMTDQTLMKQLKDEIKTNQTEMKKHKDNPSKFLAIQKKTMDINMKYMMQSMKPTLVTFIPIILILGWLNAHLAYDPLLPGKDFSVKVVLDKVTTDADLVVPEGLEIVGNKSVSAGEVVWKVNGKEGDYILEFKTNQGSYFKDVKITSSKDYKTAIVKVSKSGIKRVEIGNDKIIIMNLFGWKLGWLGSYIILSLIFSLGLRKLMKLH